MSGNIYTLYKSHCENVGKYRGIEISGVVSSVEISKVESRATLLTLLDLVLHEHRKKFGTPYNQLNGKKALVHLILMKHHWMPKQINEMKFDELLRKRLVRTVLIFTESSDQLSRATDRVPGLPASPGYVQ